MASSFGNLGPALTQNSSIELDSCGDLLGGEAFPEGHGVEHTKVGQRVQGGENLELSSIR